ncbi:MAG: surface lipoprotein assembly modifier [Thermodesulfobacteriota bacterium]
MQRMLFVAVMTGLVAIWTCAPLAAGPGRTSGYYDLGVFAYEQADYRQALDYFSRALKSDRYDVGLYHYLGKTCLKLNQTEKAAHYLRMVEKEEPDRVGLTYDRALLAQQQKDFKAALDLFEKRIKADETHVLAVYRAGICLYELKRYQKAIDYLDRAKRMSPSVRANADYYAGICLFRLEEPDTAAERFAAVKAGAASDRLSRNAEQWLEIIDAQKQGRKRYRLYLQTGVQYDDNVQLEPIDEDVFADESDWSFVGYFSGRYHVVNQHRFKAGAGYSHYQTRHGKLTDYDITGSIGDIYVKYQAAPLALGISYQPAYYWVHADSFLMRHSFSPQMTWQLNEQHHARLRYRYMINNYFEGSGRDGHANAGDLDVFHAVGPGYLSWGFGLEDNSARRDDEAHDEFEARIRMGCPVVEKIEVTVTGIYDEKDYDQPDAVIGIQREDNRYYAALSLARPVVYEWLRLAVDYNFTRNDSNIGLYDYERNAVTVSVTANL